MPRYLEKQILKDLQSKMVFVGGPRQVGKTTMALSLTSLQHLYFNWDIPSQREQILKYEFPTNGLVIFDELHKYRQWRNFLKGLYDERKNRCQFLITGSARLDYYRFGGDSLQGRYHYLRMHPLSFAELNMSSREDLQLLMNLGGFPEPFFKKDQIEAKRWSLEYRNRLIQEEVRTLEGIENLGQLELLMIRLPDLVGSPLSINALREDLQVNHKTVSRWIMALERLYSIFRLVPFGTSQLRAVKKEQKHYHYDWTLVKNPSFRFENMMACHLLKWVHYLYDTQGREMALCYFRDVHKREVDFVVTENRKPISFIECKLADDEIADGLKYLKSKFPSVPSWQLSLQGVKDYLSKEQIRVCPAIHFLKELI